MCLCNSQVGTPAGLLGLAFVSPIPKRHTHSTLRSLNKATLAWRTQEPQGRMRLMHRSARHQSLYACTPATPAFPCPSCFPCRIRMRGLHNPFRTVTQKHPPPNCSPWAASELEVFALHAHDGAHCTIQSCQELYAED